ncbi:Protein phosphatase inhibitor 2 (IPP-2) [Novymonas esmeraldas]|uniref:Protein phosphatase inhibitor 2 (IPP-2) n=1 Tax=Novymonas esmeraldas TaxID=1808958 RepID=A0AAW0EU03_9TRYP
MSRSKHVEWDEQNLEDNAEYQRQHPVTMHITEPKTPFVHVDGDDIAAEEAEEASRTWDLAVNAKVKEMKEHVVGDFSDRPQAPVSKAGRPMLAEGTLTGELAQQQHRKEFRKMRKAVYADEGAMFKKALSHAGEEEEEEGDE